MKSLKRIQQNARRPRTVRAQLDAESDRRELLEAYLKEAERFKRLACTYMKVSEDREILIAVLRHLRGDEKKISTISDEDRRAVDLVLERCSMTLAEWADDHDERVTKRQREMAEA